MLVDHLYIYKYSRYIYRNELNKAYFQHDVFYEDFKDLTRITASDKPFDIARNSKYNGH